MWFELNPLAMQTDKSLSVPLKFVGLSPLLRCGSWLQCTRPVDAIYKQCDTCGRLSAVVTTFAFHAECVNEVNCWSFTFDTHQHCACRSTRASYCWVDHVSTLLTNLSERRTFNSADYPRTSPLEIGYFRSQPQDCEANFPVALRLLNMRPFCAVKRKHFRSGNFLSGFAWSLLTAGCYRNCVIETTFTKSP